ncbi:MAG TPA: hypothetical protein VNO24_27400 [Blastocatellia bacterium]|nr:hypothetical protein [Blastocatellia bacterium]
MSATIELDEQRRSALAKLARRRKLPLHGSSSKPSMSSSTGQKMKICWIALLASHSRPACEKLTR